MKRAPGTRGPRFGIALNLVASVLLAIVVVVNLVAGSYLVVTICAVLLAANLVSIPVNRRVLAIRIDAARPRPDYALIARMEREVYGQAFHHDGAPGDTRAALDTEMDALVDACEKHQPRCYPVTDRDAAVLDMLKGATFGPDATVTLPSGRTLDGREMTEALSECECDHRSNLRWSDQSDPKESKR